MSNQYTVFLQLIKKEKEKETGKLHVEKNQETTL